MAKRFIIEGRWSANGRIVHRAVHRGAFKKMRSWAEAGPPILFGDGTQLYLSVTEPQPHDRVKEIHGYDALIDDCYYHDVHGLKKQFH